MPHLQDNTQAPQATTGPCSDGTRLPQLSESSGSLTPAHTLGVPQKSHILPCSLLIAAQSLACTQVVPQMHFKFSTPCCVRSSTQSAMQSRRVRDAFQVFSTLAVLAAARSMEQPVRVLLNSAALSAAALMTPQGCRLTKRASCLLLQPDLGDQVAPGAGSLVSSSSNNIPTSTCTPLLMCLQVLTTTTQYQAA